MGGEPRTGVRLRRLFPPLPTSLRASRGEQEAGVWAPRPAREASEENYRPGLAPNGLRSETAGWDAEPLDSGRAGAS